MQIQEERGKIGFLTATSLVIGNMIGSGIFLLPATLAFYGGISIFGWIFSSAGAILLAIVFSRLSRLIPESGGPYAYTRAGFGDFAGFLVSWGYWISIFCTNAAIAVTLVGYLGVFFPAITASNAVSAFTAIGVVWFLTLVNIMGIKKGGGLQLVTALLKIVPLLAISVIGIFYFDAGHFEPWNLSDSSDFKAIGATTALTFFAFMGMESATIPSESIKNPNRIIPLATISGTIAVLLIYIISYVVLVGLISPDNLRESVSPFADAAALLWGDSGKYLVGLGAIISTFGALNGWILLQGQVPYAIARDKLFPGFLGRLNTNLVPGAGLILSSVFITLLIASNYTRGLVNMFTFMILLTTVVVIFPFLFCSLSEVLVLLKKGDRKIKVIKPLLVGLPAFVYLMWVLTGVGKEEVYYGLLLILSGIPFFVWAKYATAKT